MSRLLDPGEVPLKEGWARRWALGVGVGGAGEGAGQA